MPRRKKADDEVTPTVVTEEEQDSPLAPLPVAEPEPEPAAEPVVEPEAEAPVPHAGGWHADPEKGWVPD